MFSYFNQDIPFFYSSYYSQKRLIKKLDYTLASTLFTNFSKNSKIIKKTYKSNSNNYKINLLVAKINILENKKDYPLIKPPFYASNSFKADYYYLTAQKELYLTDLQNASINISKALKIYQKLNYLYECAECYQTFAMIYKLCGATDVSYTMLIEAKKIYEKLQIPAKIAEINAYFGIHELQMENHQNALDYFDISLKICQQYNLKKTYINTLNWQAFTYFQKNDYKNAIKISNKVIKSPLLPIDAKAFCYETLANTYYKTNKPDSAIKYADLGLKIFSKHKNQAYNFELNLLKAKALFAKQKYALAKEILISLIKQKNPNTSTYYPANAYSLLGLVYMKENKLQQAQNMFNLAIDLEYSKNRLKGAAIDYNNLAEISLKQGNTQKANQYLEHALDLAKQIKDNDLESYLQKKLKI